MHHPTRHLPRTLFLMFGLLILPAPWAVPAPAASPPKPALHRAVEEGNAPEVRRLLGTGAPVNQKDAAGITPLWAAVDRGNQELVRVLLDAHANPNLKGPNGRTPLHHAAWCGHRAITIALVESGADPNLISILGETPLMRAVARLRKDAALALLENGADVNRHEHGMDTPLVVAANARSLPFVQLLLKHGADVDAQGIRGRTALMTASFLGYPEVVAALLEAGARTGTTNALGLDALGGALLGLHDETARVLIRAGATYTPPAASSLEGRLSRAVYLRIKADESSRAGKPDEAKSDYALAREGFLSLQPDFVAAAKTSTAMASAKERWRTVVVILAGGLAEGLQNLGEDYTRSMNYRSAAQLAALRDSKTTDEYFSTYHMLLEQETGASAGRSRSTPEIPLSHDTTLLLARAKAMNNLAAYCGQAVANIDRNGTPAQDAPQDHDTIAPGQPPDRTPAEGGTAPEASAQKAIDRLVTSAALGKLEEVRAALDSGVAVDGFSSQGPLNFSALISACGNNHLEIVQLLLDRGANINLKTKTGYTALMSASRKGHPRIVELLIDRGADVSATSGTGETALSIARRMATNLSRDRNVAQRRPGSPTVAQYQEIVKALEKAGRNK